MTDTKKPRIPRSADSITEGALKLTLKERIALKKVLDKSIIDEIADKKKDYDDAAKAYDEL